MAEHRFHVGEIVRMTHRFADQSGAGTFEVIRLLPTTANGEFHYRVKAVSGQERAVSESQMLPLTESEQSERPAG
jgi:hypothetical protein